VIRLALKASRGTLRLREHDLEGADPLLEVMLALALAIAGRVFEPDFETTPIAGS